MGKFTCLIKSSRMLLKLCWFQIALLLILTFNCCFYFRVNALEEQLESQRVTTGKQVEEEGIKYKIALVGLLVVCHT